MTRLTTGILSFSLCAAIFAGTPASAASDQKEIGKFGNWTAYVLEENGGKVCYMAAKPDKSTGKYDKRGDVVAMITHRPAENSKNVFSYMSGYSYKKGTDVDLSIDNRKFTLFTQNDMAWAADAQADASLASGIQKGSTLSVKGESGRGTKTIDTFSLKGSTKAYEAISKACGI